LAVFSFQVLAKRRGTKAATHDAAPEDKDILPERALLFKSIAYVNPWRRSGGWVVPGVVRTSAMT